MTESRFERAVRWALGVLLYGVVAIVVLDVAVRLVVLGVPALYEYMSAPRTPLLGALDVFLILFFGFVIAGYYAWRIVAGAVLLTRDWVSSRRAKRRAPRLFHN